MSKRWARGQRLHVIHKLMTEQLGNGKWNAWYAMYDWRETADTEDAARQLAVDRS